MAQLHNPEDVKIAKEILKREILKTLSAATSGGLTLLEVNQALQDICVIVAEDLNVVLSEFYIKKD